VDKSATRRSADRAQVVGHGREVLALVELGPVTLEALPGGVFDVAGQGGGGLAVAPRNTAAARPRLRRPGAGMSSSRRSGRGMRPAMATALLHELVGELAVVGATAAPVRVVRLPGRRMALSS
jgi:hypothetical protein